MEDICKGNEVVETATRLLLDSLPASLKACLREALAAGATKEAIIERVLRQTGGQRTLTVLAIEEFFASDPIVSNPSRCHHDLTTPTVNGAVACRLCKRTGRLVAGMVQWD